MFYRLEKLLFSGVLLLLSLLTHAQSYTIDLYDGQTVNSCSGFFYDSGGNTAQYLPDEDYTVTFCSVSGSIAVNFFVFDLGDGDTIRAYDGPDTLATLLGEYTGTSMFIVASSGSCLTFSFSSNAITEGNGWEATIECFFGKVSNGNGGGDWNAGSSWLGGSAPLYSDTITILSNDTVRLTGNDTIKDTYINSNGVFESNGYSLFISGNYNNAGRFADSALFVFYGIINQYITHESIDTIFFMAIDKPSGALYLNNSLFISDTLKMLQGDIYTQNDTITLGYGVGPGEEGYLYYISGKIIGNYQKWINQTGADILLPIGTNTASPTAIVNFSDLTSGSLMAKFIEENPGNSGLPLNDNDTLVNNTFVEGYWEITSANSLASTDYDLQLVGDGFTLNSFSITGGTRIVKRASSGGPWTLDGTHLEAANDTVKRTGLSGFSQFALADTSTCAAPASTTITGGNPVCTYTQNSKYYADGGNSSSYEWMVSGGTISSGQGSDTLYIDWGSIAMGGYVKVIEFNGCSYSDTINLDVTINALPVVSFSGLDSVYDTRDNTVVLTGNPVGGTFTGNGISGNNFTPATAGVGVHEIIYSYTDLNGCTNSDTAYVVVNDFNFIAGARLLTDIDNWCSADAAYTNVGATADQSAGSCWSGGTNNNVWFKFVTVSNAVKVEVRTGGSLGTMRGAQIALWNTAGIELKCINAAYNYAGTLPLNIDTLTIGHTYYISVDDRTTNGTFTLCVDDESDYDYRSSALLLSNIDNWCSANAAYNNTYATADETAGSCWSGGTNNNLWFRFVATTNAVKADIKTGGAFGTMRGQQIALWNETKSQIQCINGSYNYSGTISLNLDTLTIGRTYYISVDDRTTQGTFTLCIDDEVNYDYKSGAHVLLETYNWCSTDAQFDNVYATGDGSSGSCWSGGVSNNVWFKFVASTGAIQVDVKTGGTFGTMRGQQIALWNENGDELNCINGAYNLSGELSLNIDTLTVGNVYYISVDDRTTSGTFTLCVNDKVGFDFKSGAEILLDLDNWCSTNAQYDNTYATGDETAGSCWSGGTDHNVWFKFIATTGAVKIDVKTGGAYGTMRGQQIAIWNSSGNQVNCIDGAYNYLGTLSLSVDTLTKGRIYYISMDDRTTHGTFTLCATNKTGYDFKTGAVLLSNLNTWCSANAIYENTYATGDESAGSCWSGGTDHNVWFKFVATTNEVKVDLKTGTTFGTMRGQQLAIWNNQGNEVACINGAYNMSGTLYLGMDTLSVDSTYYISVDDRTTHGTFSLCIDDAVDYDFKSGAQLLSDLNNWCSTNAQFDNTYATTDGSAGSCWSGGVDHNVWFRFTATTAAIKIDVTTGGVYGTMRGQQIAIWNEAGTQLNCIDGAYNYSGELSLNVDTLTAGNTYWVSVDDRTTHGTFTLCASDEVGYDFKSGAELIADLDNWCSNDAEYSNTYATGDESAGSCWSGGTDHNVWFRFEAISGEIEVEVKTGGSLGTMRGQQIALWNASGNELNCIDGAYNYSGSLTLSIDTLTPGRTYYISVDDRTTHGTFTLCANNKVGFDFKAGARALYDLDNWCSSDALYTNAYATGDESAGSCWSGGTDHNVWFRFEAIFDTVSIDITTGGAYGTMRGQQTALWDASGNQLSCANGTYNYSGTLTVTSDTLTIGETYYISVDDRTTHGSFSLCINNVSGEEYWAIANGDWNVNATWSKTEGGPAATSYPTASNIVHIIGYTVDVVSNEACATLDIIVANTTAGLNIDGDTLKVYGSLTMANSGEDYDGLISLYNGGYLDIVESVTIARNGGANSLKLELSDSSAMYVNEDIEIQSTAGTGSNSELILNDNSQLTVLQDFKLNYSGGTKIQATLYDHAVLNVRRDVSFTANASDKAEVELNDTTLLQIGRNFVRGIPAYGILDCNDTSMVEFNGTQYLQVLAKDAGGGTDLFSYQNVKINNSKITSPQISLDGLVTINKSMIFIEGIVASTSTNILVFSNLSTEAGASDISFVDGPVKKIGNQEFTFPVGDQNNYQALKISAPSNTTDAFVAQYLESCAHPTYDTTLHESFINYISSCEYWTLNRTEGSSNVEVTLWWDASSCCIDNLTNLKIAVWEGAQWNDFGNGGTTGDLSAGSVISGAFLTNNTNVATLANSLPDVGISDPGGPYCPDAAPVALTGTPTDANGVFSGNGIYDNGDGTADFDPSLSGPGTHTLRYTYTSATSGCSNSASKTVTVNPFPTASMAGTAEICEGSSTEISVYFTGTAPWTFTYTLDGADPTMIVTSDNPYIFSTSQTGTYTVIALTDGNGCDGLDFGNSAVITNNIVSGKPTITPDGPTTFCQGSSVNLTSSVSPDFYIWSTGETTQTINIIETGDYTVRIVDLNSCVSEPSDPFTVIVNLLPGKAFKPIGDNVMCQDGVNTIYTTAGASYAVINEYEWFINPPAAGMITGNTTTANVDWNAAFSGIATITVRGHNSCGYGTTSDGSAVTVYALPVVDLGEDQVVCETLDLDAGNPGTSYLWSTTETTRVITVTSSDNYEVTVTDLNGCTGSDAVNVTVNHVPSVTIQPVDEAVCEGENAMFTVAVAGGGTFIYQWKNSLGNLSDGGRISGAANDTLYINSTILTDADDFSCDITTLCGSVSSNSAELIVNKRPVTQKLYHLPND